MLRLLSLLSSLVYIGQHAVQAKPPVPCSSVDGLLECTLRVEVTDVHLNFKNISFRTRTYNGMIPGPVMRATPGDRVRILLQNRLGRNRQGSGCHAHLSEFRASNSTNLHIHGIFDSSSADNTFVCIEPGSDYLYKYKLDPRTGTSTLWYHPHMDGSSAMQLYGGMAGAFEIVDAEQDKFFDFAVTQVMVLQMLNLDPTSKDYIVPYMSNGKSSTLPLELRNPENYRGALLLVNGEVAPSMTLEVGQYARLKLINALSGSTNNLNFGFTGSGAKDCYLYVLAYDGVYLSAPRLQRTVFIPSGGKTDIAVSCRTSGKHVIDTTLEGVEGYGGTLSKGSIVLSLNVLDLLGKRQLVSLPSALPGPPSYYQDLSNTRADMYHTIRMSDMKGGNTVEGVQYDKSVSYTMPHGSVQEWRIDSMQGTGLLNIHSYHQHFTHFQVVKSSLDNGVVSTVGDYRDTLVIYRDLNYTIRFIAPFQGLMMIHCHILKHEDLGMMTLANITAAPASLAFSSAAPWAHQVRVAFATAMLAVVLGVSGLMLILARVRRSEASSSCGCYRSLPGDDGKVATTTSYVTVGRPIEVL